ncbi:M1 family metallopeptidase [Nocardioides sp. GY 10127]|uniref:M1 family metallopeptidase n=1 Tax=Nocardioides sp. GY 10127 TaxID=2569762 RepID=UPI0010A79249|nr:M1 family metallopeptidase [Nocardioides sp. GY 10127]TIC84160.1 M1 family metallopeptidase [Nocardioides sp. GY 10127]
MGLPTADDYLPGHGDRSFAVRHYDLELDYAVEGNRLDGRAVLDVEVLEATDRLVLDLAHLSVGKVRVASGWSRDQAARSTRKAARSKPAARDGAPGLKKFTTRSHRVVLTLDGEAEAGTRLTVTVGYSGHPKPLVTRHLGDAGWEELTDGVIVAAQPHGSPTWFPCNDRPDDKATYRLALTVTAGYRVEANGTLVRHTRRGSAEVWVWEQAQPMATYLATVQIGRYREWPLPARPASGLPVAVVAGDLDRTAFADAFGRQHEMVDVFEEHFGPYPFDSYRVVVTDDDLEIPLESQTLSTFGRNLVRGDWDATRLIAHELAHQWFGNAVTLRDWKDIWLHEGFACYSEWVWSEASGGPTAAQQAAHHHAGLEAKDTDLLLADPGPDLMFDDRVYKRGALTLHQLRCEVGDAAFFSLLRSWVADFAGGSVTTEDFLAHASKETGVNVATLLRPWLHETSLPPLPTAGR